MADEGVFKFALRDGGAVSRGVKVARLFADLPDEV